MIRNEISDKALLQKVNQRLARWETGDAQVTATVCRGEVTLSGTFK